MRYLSIFIVLAFVLSFSSSCNKDLTMQERFDQDVKEIEAFIAARNWNAQKTSEGIYYVIDEAGDSQKPSITSVVTVKYAGKFLDLTSFDSAEKAEFGLFQVIQGWQIGIPKFGKGGKGKLLIPSKFAYGERAVSGRSHAPLYFEVELIDFK
jgi:FKBP-type peptidyl-prolyl cis-trans isomerase FkpA